MNLREFKTIKNRREALEKEIKTSFQHIGSYSLDDKQASTKNCENMIGVAQVPIGVAGPLRINGQGLPDEGKEYFLPLATTEGALVASISRGCKALAESGGATVLVETVGTTRGPVFRTSGIDEGMGLKKWLDNNVDMLNAVAKGTSSHLKLIKLGVRMVGNFVYVRFYFDTEDAMGMNMATIASQALVERIERETGIPCLSVAGNFDIDKKPAYLNSISGRGRRVWAEAVIPGTVLRTVLKTTPEALYNTWLSKCMIGSALSGSMGFNAQYANVIAALFIATGQDPAHVVEGSIGITTVEIRGKNLYISVHLPALMVGTVGGGTSLATQREALEILGCLGAGKVVEFASVVAGAVLAGEISLIASLAEGSLSRSHERLARGKNSNNQYSNSK